MRNHLPRDLLLVTYASLATSNSQSTLLGIKAKLPLNIPFLSPKLECMDKDQGCGQSNLGTIVDTFILREGVPASSVSSGTS